MATYIIEVCSHSQEVQVKAMANFQVISLNETLVTGVCNMGEELLGWHVVSCIVDAEVNFL